MGPLDDVTGIEKHICDMADLNHEPIGGTFELLPVCNMNCKMCYVRMSPEEQRRRGPLLTLEQWTEIARDAVDNGLLFLLLTGGEPLLYPDFAELYQRLHRMGIVLSINTNGTLLTEELAQLLGRMPPRRVNMTIYGASDETYAELCGNPKGFTQFSAALERLERYEIPFKLNCSLTPRNVGDLDAIYALAAEHKCKLDVAPYMFPPVRKGFLPAAEGTRLTEKETADIYFKDRIRAEGLRDFAIRMAHCRAYCEAQSAEPKTKKNGMPCRGGSSTWWINWQGNMTGCCMIENPGVSVLTTPFKECWATLRSEMEQVCIAQKCADCPKKQYCLHCAAAALAETGKTEGVPEYLCRVTDRIVEQAEELLQKVIRSATPEEMETVNREIEENNK